MSRKTAARPLESGRAETAPVPEDRTPTVTNFAVAAEWTGITNDDREAWLRAREGLLTASDMAAVLGVDTRRGALAVYTGKVQPPRDRERIGLDDPRFWGTVLEQPILRAVAAFHGWAYRPGGALLRSRRHPHLGATLDAEIDRGDGLGWLDLEGKTTRITRDWDQEQGALPDHVLIQVQHQLLVTGAPRAVVFALLQGSRPCSIEVEPSPELFAVIVEESERFIEAVRLREPPDPGPTDGDAAALSRLYPNAAPGTAVRLGPEALAWTQEILVLNAEKNRIEARGKELRNAIRASMGPAQWGLLPEPVEGKAWWRWADEHVEAYVVPSRDGRKLLHMKNGPALAPDAPALPAAAPVPSLAQQLSESASRLDLGPGEPELDEDLGAVAAPPKRTRRTKEKAE